MENTFPSYGYYGGEGRVARSWFTALLASSVIYIAAGIAILAIGAAAKQVIQEKPVDVTFVERVAAPEPPPVIEVKPEVAPPAAAPVVPKNMKIRQLDEPPPPKVLTAPKEMPKQAPKEVDASLDRGVAVYGEVGEGDPAGLEGGMKGGVAGGHVGAIALPENAEPPTAVASNLVPAYPQEARAEGKTGVVILKIIVNVDGSVGDVSVMRGDEPFTSAAIAAVKKWKYQPAKYRGQAITVYHVVKIPFKLTV